MNEQKIKEFKEMVNTKRFDEDQKKEIFSIIDFFEGKIMSSLAKKTCLLEGAPGYGKTHLCFKLIEALEVPVLYMGSVDIPFKNITRVHSLEELLKKLENFKDGLVYLDDLRFVLKYDKIGGDFGVEDKLTEEENSLFMKLIEHFNSDVKKILLLNLNDSDFMEGALEDRMEIKIEFNPPTKKERSIFLDNNFGKSLTVEDIEYFSKNTNGINYRDLFSMVKKIYYMGNYSFKSKLVKKIVDEYVSRSLGRWDIEKDVKLKLNDIIGQEKNKKEVNRLKLYFEKDNLKEKYGIKRGNFLIFSGDPGIGKTHFARAFAGEINCPLIKIGMMDISRRFESIGDIAKLHKKSVILIDDADKMIGGRPYDQDSEGPIFSAFNNLLDEAAKVEGAIFILTVNNITRLGDAFADRFNVLNFSYPTKEDRSELLKRYHKKVQGDFELDEKLFLKHTENMNYRKIERFWNSCVFSFIENGKVLEEDIEPFGSGLMKKDVRLDRGSQRGGMFG